MFRFTIRELVLCTIIVALLAGWWRSTQAISCGSGEPVNWPKDFETKAGKSIFRRTRIK
jgi:hypothetical protein